MTYDDYINSTPAEYYMQECFELAKGALGRTSPNPVVGAIVLDKNGIPAGRGYHKKAGFEHAEVIAIKEAGELARGGTLIVNLEPCTHTGKTPPCTDLIIKSQIKEVIFCNHDPNPLVNKKGEKILLDNNIKVISKVLEFEGFEANKFFFKWIKTKLPWIALKQAQTLDGKIALRNKNSKWISGELARKEVHKLRNEYDAVLVGANTVETDNPKLTVRDVEDIKNARNPLRIILDPDLITKPDANVYSKSVPVILVTKSSHSEDKISNYLKYNESITVIKLPENENKKIDLKQLFSELGKKEILSVLIEAGPVLGGDLILNKLIDEYILFVSPKVFGDNDAISSLKIRPLESIDKSYNFKIFKHKTIGNDLMLSLRPFI
ncbi:MAG: bifunctional diaminohydroxyphosphoribosylaminopyrimidine deaminase/5-amino-6-(5-phosphoribosylamino)uracil reductase RibD [Candidatus Melainabacteria bacterium]|nr:bifunctional diaminohydroxyphosphoribosylaminopyrimidine deaminase/5-amino-6-(5-phosphoribosylamino)uracil reductase RibD [Candidatus Melainabacteria bacterium]